MSWIPKKLVKFEEKIIKLYEKNKIKFPIHLSGGKDQAKELIKIFKDYKKGDWVFSTWRNHWHYLLGGYNPKSLEKQIINNGSMHIYDKKFFTSAIVGGICPIALGIAWSLKRKNNKNQVWAFIGDMAASGGLFHECVQYASGHDLPITFVIEDNNLSVKTNTREVWGIKNKPKILYYKYKRKFPHAGSGKFILF